MLELAGGVLVNGKKEGAAINTNTRNLLYGLAETMLLPPPARKRIFPALKLQRKVSNVSQIPQLAALHEEQDLLTRQLLHARLQIAHLNFRTF